MTGGAGRPSGRVSRSAHARPTDRDRGARFRTALLRVLLFQAVALGLLWLLQATYHG